MSEPRKLQTATDPFVAPSGDVILRSSDNVDFYVFRTVLSLSSQFFDDLFSIPQPPKAEQDDESKPLIPVEEDALHLDYMLRFLYPCPDPVITQLEEIERMLDLTSKYDLPIISQRLESYYLRTGEYKTKPVKAYFFACHYQWREAAQSAARATLGYSIDELITQDVGMTDTTMSEYRELLRYHTRVRNACRDACVSGDGIANASYHKCSCKPFGRKGKYMPDWFIKYIDRVSQDFMYTPSLALDNMLNIDQIVYDLDSRKGCSQCSTVGCIPEVMKFIRELRKRLASVIDNIGGPFEMLS